MSSHGLDADVFDEVFDDFEVDVGFEESDADLGHRVGDVFLGDGALAAEGLEGTLKFFGEILKHGSSSIAMG